MSKRNWFLKTKLFITACGQELLLKTNYFQVRQTFVANLVLGFVLVHESSKSQHVPREKLKSVQQDTPLQLVVLRRNFLKTSDVDIILEFD